MPRKLPLHLPRVCWLILLLALPSGPARAASERRSPPALTTVQVLGRAEYQEQSEVWRPLVSGQTVQLALRTGTGRVVLRVGAGRLTLSSHSRLQLKEREPEFQEGHFWLEGPLSSYVLGYHLASDEAGRVRVDLDPLSGQLRLAVLSGQLRVSYAQRNSILKAGQQLLLRQRRVLAFSEDDPWYSAQFLGTGQATIEAVQGQVQRLKDGQPGRVSIGTALDEGDLLKTAAQSWAELGFSGGGYLRLAEQSELKVLGLERTNKGRVISLQLLRGSAWNVVEKGQGGYKITTPVVSTAVRGTQFRVDASGLVKVMDGEVALPSEANVAVTVGQQKEPGQRAEALQFDALDKFNQQLDQSRARPMVFEVSALPRWNRGQLLEGRVLPQTVLSAQAVEGGRAVSLPIIQDDQGRFQIALQNLAEGQYRLNITAKRYQEQRHWHKLFGLDRTPPQLLHLEQAVRGRLLSLRGEASDSSGEAVTLVIRQADQTFTRRVRGPFHILLPALVGTELQVQALDAAGNEVDATIR